MTDNVNHPKHYTSHPSGVEAIEITRWLRGPYSNACKYVMRGWEGLKGDPIEDLQKAIWYLDDAEKFPDDGSVLSVDAGMRWLEYYDAEPCKEKKECLGCILIASGIEKWNTPPSITIHAAKKLIQERITYLQSRTERGTITSHSATCGIRRRNGMMTRFYVGQKVLVKDCSCGKIPEVEEMLGKICEIKSVGTDIMVYQDDKKRAWHFLPDDLEPVTETPKEITLNGATYVLKEEQKPEHEWKFGDVASHPDYGVGMVFSEPDEENDVMFAYNGDWDWADIKDLTFLRRADFSV